MPQHHVHSVMPAQMPGQLLGQKYRTMLASGAPKCNGQTLEAARLIVADACIHQRRGVGQILMHALLLVEIVDHRTVFAGKGLEALLASGIGKTADVEDKSAAVSCLVFWRAAAMKRKTKNPYYQFFRLRSTPVTSPWCGGGSVLLRFCHQCQQFL